MSKAIVCIGSNTDKARRMITQAVGRLQEAGCKLGVHSRAYREAPYLNYVAEIECGIDFQTLHSLSKDIERAMGRTPEMKKAGIVPIDIDIVLFDDVVMRQADFEAPYFIRGYKSILRRKR